MPMNDLNFAPTMETGSVCTAIAVCGCGHDGRLGVGEDAPSAMGEIALIDDFLPTFPSAATIGEARQVACGAYHTLVLTSTGLYGWGLHEDGQLGLGQPSIANATAAAENGALGNAGTTAAAAVPTHVDRPVRIPISEFSGVDGAEDEAPVTIISIHCGADHSVVCSTAGVYVTGRNDCGQLGLGHTDTVYTWTRLCAAIPQTTPDSNADHTTTMSCAASPMMSSLPSACDSYPRGRHSQLLYGRITHISCGTHHTLLALSDAIILRPVAPSSPSSQQSAANSNGNHELVHYPSLLMACGRGDFGELGYDGDAWAVLQAKAQRQERALRSSLQQQQVHSNAGDGQHGAPDSTYKFKWKAAAAVKQRRPPFNSAFFEPVEAVDHLKENSMQLPTTCVEDLRSALLHRGCTAHKLAEDVIRQCHDRTAAYHMCPPPTASALQTSSSVPSPWEVAKLQAMHHHSAVTLRRRHTEGKEQHLVLHWGCYYCSDIEDAAASHPRDILEDAPDAFISDDVSAAGAAVSGLCVGIHAGEESLLRYRETCSPSVPASTAAPTPAQDDQGVASLPCCRTPPHAPLLQIMGSGNLGLGTDDSFTRTWTNVAFLDAPMTARGQAAVHSVAGRSHYLIWIQDQWASSPFGHSAPAAAPSHERPTVASSSYVFGFGDNLHGQIGAPALQTRDVPGDEVVVAPRPVLRDGDVLRAATTVQQSLRDAAAPTAQRRRPATAKVLDSFTSEAGVFYEVVAIRAVEAGARHSVFLVDVRPAATTATSATAGV